MIRASRTCNDPTGSALYVLLTEGKFDTAINIYD
jgi:hypothetical protein